MRVLFLCAGLTQGGIETLLVRKSRWMKEAGHTPIVWALEGGALEPRLREYAEVRVIGKLNGYLEGLSSGYKACRGNFDVIFATGPQTLLLGYLLAKDTGARLLAGAYHPAAYCLLPVEKPPYHVSLIRDLFGNIPEKNLVFMNEATRASHADYFQRDFKDSRIVPLAIDDPGLRTIPSVSQSPREIVSVGRLVDFKPYPLGVIEIVRDLRKQGLDIGYRIYGKGELRPLFEQKIREYGLEDSIHLEGEIPYSELNEALKKAFVFVGMGTSVIEAAVLGIPSLVAPIFDSSGLTSGWLREHLGYDVGEEPGIRNMKEDISTLFRMSDVDYSSACRQERESASKFLVDSVGSQFIKVCDDAVDFKADLTRLSYLRALVTGAAWAGIPGLRNRTIANRTAWSTRKGSRP